MPTLQEIRDNPNISYQDKVNALINATPGMVQYLESLGPEGAQKYLGSLIPQSTSQPKQESPGFFEGLRSGYQRGAGNAYQTLANTADLFGADSLKQHFKEEQAYRYASANPRAKGAGAWIGENVTSPRTIVPAAAATVAAPFVAAAGGGATLANAMVPLMYGVGGAINQEHLGAGQSAATGLTDAAITALPMLKVLKNAGFSLDKIKGLFTSLGPSGLANFVKGVMLPGSKLEAPTATSSLIDAFYPKNTSIPAYKPSLDIPKVSRIPLEGVNTLYNKATPFPGRPSTGNASTPFIPGLLASRPPVDPIPPPFYPTAAQAEDAFKNANPTALYEMMTKLFSGVNPW